MLMNEMEEKEKFNKQITTTFAEMDTNGNGTIGQEEFEAICHDEKMQALFKTIGIDVTPETASGFFQMLDLDGSQFYLFLRKRELQYLIVF